MGQNMSNDDMSLHHIRETVVRLECLDHYIDVVHGSEGQKAARKFEALINSMKTTLWMYIDAHEKAQTQQNNAFNKDINDIKTELSSEIKELGAQLSKDLETQLKAHQAQASKTEEASDDAQRLMDTKHAKTKFETAKSSGGLVDTALSQASTQVGLFGHCEEGYDLIDDLDTTTFQNIELPRGWSLRFFSGRINERISHWSNEVVNTFAQCEIRESAWVTLATNHLRDEALDRWTWKSRNLVIGSISWADFINIMQARIPYGYHQDELLREMKKIEFKGCYFKYVRDWQHLIAAVDFKLIPFLLIRKIYTKKVPQEDRRELLDKESLDDLFNHSYSITTSKGARPIFESQGFRDEEEDY